MDWIQALLITFLSIGIINLAVALVVSWLIARWFHSLEPAYRTAIMAFLIVVGLVLVVTLIGAEVGAVMILVAAFTAVFGLLDKGKGKRRKH